MINERDCIKILNAGEYKFSHEEMLLIREFLTTLAQIEFEWYRQNQTKPECNECNLLQESQYRRAG